jgi:hypothetical protein
MLGHCSGDLLPFSHKSISEVQHCVPIHPKGVQWSWGQGSACQSSSSTQISTNHFCVYFAFNTWALTCWNRKRLGSNTFCHFSQSVHFWICDKTVVIWQGMKLVYSISWLHFYRCFCRCFCRPNKVCPNSACTCGRSCRNPRAFRAKNCLILCLVYFFTMHLHYI